MTEPAKEFHFIPQDRREHVRSGDCWCKPTLSEAEGPPIWLHEVFKPTVAESTNAEEITAFFEKTTGEKLHAQMLQAMLGGAIRVVVARDEKEIIGMMAYATVLNPFIGKQGYAVLVDLSGGLQLEMD